MTERTRASWLLYALGTLCAGAIVVAVLVVGPGSSNAVSVTRTAKVAQGVVQSTVSGSGNLQAASQLNLGFKTSGTVTHIYVSQGDHVTKGELLATLDPQSAEVTLEQANASLQSAEANLAEEEETDGEGSSTGGSGASNADAASVENASYSPVAAAAAAPNDPTPTSTGTATTPASTTPGAASPTSTTPTTTTSTGTTTTAPSTTTPSSVTSGEQSTSTQEKGSTTGKGTGDTREGQSKETSSGSSTTKATISTATREANLASAKAAVKSDALTVHGDEQAVQDTKLYAPETGTIVSLTGQVGEVVSGSGTTKSSSSGSASSGSGTSASAAGGASSTRSGTGAASSSASSSESSSSSFAVLSDLSSMQLVVALSESEIGNVKDGQIATVTVEALSSTKLAAHVREVALTSSSSSGAVSYDVTFQLDQLASGIKLGMSATAEVVIKQAEGINVPTSAITADEVTVERDGKQMRRRVVAGLVGDTSTIVLSGLKAGETVVLPAASTTSSSTSSLSSRLSSRLGGASGGLGGAATGGGGFPGGGGAFFRGGG